MTDEAKPVVLPSEPLALPLRVAPGLLYDIRDANGKPVAGTYDTPNAPVRAAGALQIVTAVNAYPEIVRLREALRVILDAEEDFRAGMPEGWEGDPLTDACAAARAALGDA